MIVITRRNGTRFAVNPDIMERIHESPDTHLVTLDGATYVVRESLVEVVGLIANYRAYILFLASGSVVAMVTLEDANLMALLLPAPMVLVFGAIVLFAMSTVDQAKFDKLRNSLATGFGTVVSQKVDTATGTVVPPEYTMISPTMAAAAVEIMVEGHAANGVTTYPSTWELSSARSVNVLKYLVDHGASRQGASAPSHWGPPGRSTTIPPRR